MKHIEVNMGPLDRTLRGVAGIALVLGYAAGIITGPFAYLIGAFGIFMAVTAITGYCFMYRLLGFEISKK